MRRVLNYHPQAHNAVAIANACRDAGGVLMGINMPTKEAWDAEIATRKSLAPGCGDWTHVEGTNGGRMRCGALLTQLGETKPYFCARCELGHKT